MKQSNEDEGVFKRYLTLEEQRKLLAVIKQDSSEIARRDGAVIRLLIGSGMRIGECLAITTGDAADALQCNYLFVPKARRKAQACDLSIYLTRSVREALRELLAMREGAEVAEALIVSRNSAAGGKAMTARAFENRVAHWAGLAGLPEVSPHWFRHTHAKNIMRSSQAADPLRIAQISLGQVSRRSTEIYTRPDREELATALNNVDGAVNGKRRVRMADLRRAHEGRASV